MSTSIGTAILAFGLIRLTISFINWISQMHLPSKYLLKNKPLVSILIPARNEEENIGNLLDDLVAIKYSPIEIYIYNDCSTDNTAEIVWKYASLHKNIHLIEGKSLPEKWMGKNFACHQLASVAKGEKLLFLDADVRVCNNILEKSLSYMDKYNLKLLSIFPTQIMPSLGSRLVVPIMNWILLSLLPLPLIRLSNQPSLSAANGQFMFFDSKEYNKIKPHLLFRNNKVEDMAIIREYKRKKLSCATLLGKNDIYCRMYSDLEEGIDGFSKNVFQFFGGSIFLTFLFALITTIAPFYIFIFKGPGYGFIYLSFILLIRIFISLASKQSVKNNLLLLVPQQFIFWKIIVAAFTKLKHNNLTWKGRNISSVS